MISIIIPTFNEELTIADCLQSILGCGEECEVIVVDAGSVDRTLEIVEGFADVRVVRSAKGRAVQMNAGARLAKGGVLWFLHADSKFSNTAIKKINQAVLADDFIAGYFRFSLDSPKFAYRIIEAFVRVRTEFFNTPYGDQGLFLESDMFFELGCFTEKEILEDLYFVRKLKKKGRLGLVNLPLYTSSRNWDNNGTVKTTLKHWLIVVLDWLGFSAKSIRRLCYHSC